MEQFADQAFCLKPRRISPFNHVHDLVTPDGKSLECSVETKFDLGPKLLPLVHGLIVGAATPIHMSGAGRRKFHELDDVWQKRLRRQAQQPPSGSTLAIMSVGNLSMLASPLIWQHVYETSSPSYQVRYKGKPVAEGRTIHRQGAVLVELEGAGHKVILKRKKDAKQITVQLDETKRFCVLDHRPSNREPLDVEQ